MFTCTGGSTVQIAGFWRRKRIPKDSYTSLQKLNSDLVWHAFDYGLQLACGQGTRTHNSIPTATTALFSHLVSVHSKYAKAKSAVMREGEARCLTGLKFVWGVTWPASIQDQLTHSAKRRMLKNHHSGIQLKSCPAR